MCSVLGKAIEEAMIKKTKRSIKWVNDTKNPLSTHGKLNYAGIHLLADFWYGKVIENSKEIEKILIGAAKEAKNTPLGVKIYKFSPQGITGVVLLAESHIALHTWPQFNYVAIDIFTCGERAIPYKALDYLKKEFQPKKVEVREIKRGIFP